MEKKIKAWIVMDSISGYVDYTSLHRSMALKNRAEGIQYLSDEKLKRKWRKQLKIIPCTITYKVPKEH